MVRFQILDRRNVEPFLYHRKGQIYYTGPVVPPAPEEAGWKDTVRAEPQMVTRMIVKFEGFTARYLWHCHIRARRQRDDASLPRDSPTGNHSLVCVTAPCGRAASGDSDMRLTANNLRPSA